MSLDKNKAAKDEDKIILFLNDEEVMESKHLKEEIEDIEMQILMFTEKKKKIDKILHDLEIKLNKKINKADYHKLNMSEYILSNFSREELIAILDDFIRYKDYFENPPKEAYEVDDYDYTQCKEAKEIEELLYKYEIYDTTYSEVKLPMMERKYGYYKDHAKFSREKLTLDEILAVLTWLHRGERWCGGFYNEAIKEKTFYNLLKRMEEIRNELIIFQNEK